jgi:DNA-binding XRE family transcriptional regulator
MAGEAVLGLAGGDEGDQRGSSWYAATSCAIISINGAVLRKLRAGRGWTQEQLARRAKLSRDYVAALEAGHKDNPPAAALKRLARALGVSIADLLE